MPNIDSLDDETLAAHLCGIEEEEDRDVIGVALLDKFNIDIDNFEKIIAALLPMMTLAISPLTERAYIGIADKSTGVWLIKRDAVSDFMSSVIEWLGGNEIKESDKAMQRDVIINGKKEFEITIVKE